MVVPPVIPTIIYTDVMAGETNLLGGTVQTAAVDISNQWGAMEGTVENL